jgi:beta-galactosidase GanA
MMKMKTFAAAIVAALFPFGLAGYSQGTAHPIPSIAQQNGRYALMVDGAPFLMLGAQANNSSDWPATLPKVWSAIEYLHANTLEIPIYWEQFEPKARVSSTTRRSTRVLAQARAHHVHLVLLWFGTWKNGSQHYMPEWMKLDPDRYCPRGQQKRGTRRLAVPVCTGLSRCGHPRIHGVHAAPESG